MKQMDIGNNFSISENRLPIIKRDLVKMRQNKPRCQRAEILVQLFFPNILDDGELRPEGKIHKHL